MTTLLITTLRTILTGMLLAGTPLLLARGIAPAARLAQRLSSAGILAVILCLATALGLHTARIPITPGSLLLTHLAVLAATLAGTLILKSSRSAGQMVQYPNIRSLLSNYRLEISAFCLLLLLLFPYTHFTGIDTYKWQDLATSVRMEQSLPWIVHPLSLFGFTPRSYPPAHPVLLATVQMTGGLGVEGGFAVVSFFTGLLGAATATTLARRLFPPRLAAAAGLLYCFAPVFVRYAHWSTGRGLFLAIFPALIAALLPDPDTPATPGFSRTAASLRRTAIIITLSLLLLMTHKVALVAVPLTLAAALFAALVTARIPAGLRIALSLPFLAAAAAMVTPALLPGPAGLPFGLMRTGVLRFAWMLPFAIAGLWLPPPADDGRRAYARRFLFFATLPALPLAFERQMYGALYALPFISMGAVDGLHWLGNALRPARLRRTLPAVAAILTLLAATATVIERSRLACPPALYRAALFLESHDPQGPFMIHAPGIARTRIQAYVSGCARFSVQPGADARLQRSELPPWHQPTLRTAVDAWAATLRGLFTLGDTDVAWYGNPLKHYYFVIHGQGTAPAGATRIYDRDHVAIYAQTP